MFLFDSNKYSLVVYYINFKRKIDELPELDPKKIVAVDFTLEFDR